MELDCHCDQAWNLHLLHYFFVHFAYKEDQRLAIVIMQKIP